MQKLRKLAQLWAQLPYKRFIKVFAIASLGLWLGFVFLFYAISQNTSPPKEEMDKLLAQSNPEIQEEKKKSPPPSFSPDMSGNLTHLSPLDLYAHRDLMQHLHSHGHLSEAIPHLERIFPKFQGDSKFMHQAAKMFQSVGKYEQAHRASRLALKMQPQNTELKSVEIMSLYRQGKVNEALELSKQYLENHPGDPQILTAKGTILAEQNPHSPRADQLFRKAIAKDSEFLPAHYQLGRKHQLMGNFRDALHRLQYAAKIAPLDGKVRGQLGMAYFHLRMDKKAEREFLTALNLNPGDYNTRYNLGELWMARSQKQSITNAGVWRRKALESYLSAIQYNPKHTLAHFRAGLLLQGNNQYKEAIRHFQKALETDPQNVQYMIQIAVAHEHLGNKQTARGFLMKAFEIDPLNKVVVQKLRMLSEVS